MPHEEQQIEEAEEESEGEEAGRQGTGQGRWAPEQAPASTDTAAAAVPAGVAEVEAEQELAHQSSSSSSADKDLPSLPRLASHATNQSFTSSAISTPPVHWHILQTPPHEQQEAFATLPQGSLSPPLLTDVPPQIPIRTPQATPATKRPIGLPSLPTPIPGKSNKGKVPTRAWI